MKYSLFPGMGSEGNDMQQKSWSNLEPGQCGYYMCQGKAITNKLKDVCM